MMKKMSPTQSAILEIIQNDFADIEFTSRDVQYNGKSVSGSTLKSLADRGYLIVVDDSSPKTYKLAENIITKTEEVSSMKKEKPSVSIGESIMGLRKTRSEIVASINMFKHRVNDDSFADEKGSGVGIYKIVYKPDPSKLYIGKTDRPFEMRWAEHRKHLEEGTHHCAALQEQFDKSGKNFNDFEFAPVQEVEKDHIKIDMRERYWIQKYEEDENYTLFNTMKPKLHI